MLIKIKTQWNNFKNQFNSFFHILFSQNLAMKVYDKNNDTVAFGTSLIFMKESLHQELDQLVEKSYDFYVKKI